MVEAEAGRVGHALARRQERGARRRRREEEDEDEEVGEGRMAEDEEMYDDDEDDSVHITGCLSFHNQAREKLIADYEAKSLYQRYGLNNDYIQFKNLWHEAAHGDDGKPLPEAARWFSQNNGDREDAEDEDEDLVIAGEVVDLKCPLSLVMMTEPYTSKQCKHTFQKVAIMEYLKSQPRGGGTCPQSGCDKVCSIPFLTDAFISHP
jgi:SUMO ligase MMS21 Smc5/6 complex component